MHGYKDKLSPSGLNASISMQCQMAHLSDEGGVAKAGHEVVCGPTHLDKNRGIDYSPTTRQAGNAPGHLEQCSCRGESQL